MGDGSGPRQVVGGFRRTKVGPGESSPRCVDSKKGMTYRLCTVRIATHDPYVGTSSVCSGDKRYVVTLGVII